MNVFMGAARMPVAASVDATPDQRRVVQMAAGLLLDYPGDSLPGILDAATRDADLMPAAAADEIGAFCQVAREWGLRRLQEHYVETFDQRRRTALYLTYYSAGDTRGRGAAILGFREVMRRAGFEMDREELPDYLPVVLEFCALNETASGDELLRANREGLEVIRAALVSASSPYAHLLEALCTTLPPLDADTLARYQELINQGPPTELVGIAALDATPSPLTTGGRS
ncbi:Nitrate reductase molybdenum cofactor assembly chaperone [Acidipropionibacterium acidipropionici ATCC 4875]|uniref:Nitrate reductase molybdenum cofactor assembly chaperone n=2 Tax=Acidipropionibacterium acidipropionici TaxID=1748 RepID=K7RP77_ACIA4|nr:Nitrate reductase molybdenum cofactor assembly chaperone [Acidipropionibacterium acidipropionici ATCC 4875]